MKQQVYLVNYTEAAEIFGVHRKTISDLARKYLLTPKRKPGIPGKYNGLDRDDMNVIGRALNTEVRFSA